MTTSPARTRPCRDCGKPIVTAYLEADQAEQDWWLNDEDDGRIELDPIPAPAPGELPRHHCYLVQPDPVDDDQLVAIELRFGQIPGAREHGQQFYRVHPGTCGARARREAALNAAP